ncbi:MAG: radical SAM protein [Acidobacteriota bacterium]
MDIAVKIKKLDKAIKDLSTHSYKCQLCPRQCSVNRKKEWGYCSMGYEASVSHVGLHFGEEPILSGHKNHKKRPKSNPSQSSGSGTIFFTGCHLKCLFCQNHQISWGNLGKEISIKELSNNMLEIQKKGALNINLVSPTHMLIPILSALKLAYKNGLTIPLVYNSSGYERDLIIQKLDGIIDIYLPDLKYFSTQLSKKLSGVPNYFDHAKKAILEMSDQQPNLIFNDHEIIQQGLIIRHLILPGQVNDTLHILKWIKENISNSFGISLMSQFHPCFKTPPEFQRKITQEEYKKIIRTANNFGFEQIYTQPELFSDDGHLIPDFKLKNPFQCE